MYIVVTLNLCSDLQNRMEEERNVKEIIIDGLRLGEKRIEIEIEIDIQIDIGIETEVRIETGREIMIDMKKELIVEERVVDGDLLKKATHHH